MWHYLRRKRVYIKIYLNDKEVNLDSLTDNHLIELRNALNKLLNYKENSIIRYEANAYVNFSCFKLPKTTFEVEAYKMSKYGSHIHSIPSSLIDNLIGKRKEIFPEKELIKTWGRVEAEFGVG